VPRVEGGAPLQHEEKNMLTPPTVHSDELERGIVRMHETELPIGCLPFLIEGVVDQWPAMTRWSLERLTAAHGDDIVECFTAPREKSSFLQQVSERRRLRFADFLAHAFREEATDELYYLRIDAGDALFERLASDFEIPPILDRYQPAATGIWIGQRGNVTPFHHDWWHSCLAQVRGRKRYVLIHPMEARKLQASWPAPARYDLDSAPPFDSDSGDRFSMGFDGTLEPGQILYIPPYWMHQVDTLESGNISMPIRFDTEQSPDVDLFQLSQDSILRTLTNQPLSDPEVLVQTLRDNRSRFAQLEREFVEALCSVREIGVEPEEILAATATTPPHGD
jgi:hypothetical protein